MDIKLYNTLTKKIETLEPINNREVKIYQCGPTVYDRAHIGNLRTYISNDILRRSLEYLGYEVIQAMNITDVDDKTINRSIKENISRKELVKKYEDFFWDDLKELNVLKPNIPPLRATEHIKDMIDMIEELLKIGIAYKSEDGIYFDISKSQKYGELAGLKVSDLDGKNTESRINIQNDEYDKTNPKDFALWKFEDESKSPDSVWQAPFGLGRPGWHIECSAMSKKALGQSFDIHTGAVDLIFPHHTNEIAQSKAVCSFENKNACEYVPARYWIHFGFVNIKDEKMSKSLNNFTSLEELKNKGFSPLSFRYWTLQANYKTQVNFSFEALEASENALKKIKQFILSEDVINKDKKEELEAITSYKNEFIRYIVNDLDIPGALSLVWKLIQDERIQKKSKKELLIDFDRVFGLGLDKVKSDEIPGEIKIMAEERLIARKNKDWAKSDEIRKKIEQSGFSISDTSDETYHISISTP